MKLCTLKSNKAESLHIRKYIFSIFLCVNFLLYRIVWGWREVSHLPTAVLPLLSFSIDFMPSRMHSRLLFAKSNIFRTIFSPVWLTDLLLFQKMLHYATKYPVPLSSALPNWYLLKFKRFWKDYTKIYIGIDLNLLYIYILNEIHSKRLSIYLNNCEFSLLSNVNCNGNTFAEVNIRTNS